MTGQGVFRLCAILWVLGAMSWIIAGRWAFGAMYLAVACMWFIIAQGTS